MQLLKHKEIERVIERWKRLIKPLMSHPPVEPNNPVQLARLGRYNWYLNELADDRIVYACVRAAPSFLM